MVETECVANCTVFVSLAHILCLIASGLSSPPCMPAACSWKNEPLAALIRYNNATCVADPLFPRIARMYVIVCSLVITVSFSTSVGSE